MKYFIRTFGCQMNYSDSERVAAVLEKSGYEKTNDKQEADVFIFNTCSIRQKGEDRVFGMLKNIARQRRANPRLLIGLTGCMVRKTCTRNSDEKDPLLKNDNLKLDFVFNIKDTHLLPKILAEAEPILSFDEEMEVSDYLQITPSYTSAFQAFVPIQTGCDKYCTYCIVPYSRGREESRPFDEIILECENLVKNECKEITLVGQTVNSYGLSVIDKQGGFFDRYGKIPFVTLLTEIDKLKKYGLNRIRYTSPHPRDITPELIFAHRDLKTMVPHIHLPIQSGDDSVLQKMNRKYTVADYKKIITLFREILPNICVTTDIIIGFCGESEERFQNTYEFFKEMEFDQAFIARYSQRSGTVAAKCFKDDISDDEKARRWHKMNNLLKKISLKRNQLFLNKKLEVLVERYNYETKEAEGRSREHKLVQFPSVPEKVGKIIDIIVKDALNWVLKGKEV